jgi:hypothetical protein
LLSSCSNGKSAAALLPGYKSCGGVETKVVVALARALVLTTSQLPVAALYPLARVPRLLLENCCMRADGDLQQLADDTQMAPGFVSDVCTYLPQTLSPPAQLWPHKLVGVTVCSCTKYKRLTNMSAVWHVYLQLKRTADQRTLPSIYSSSYLYPIAMQGGFAWCTSATSAG